MTDNIFNLPSPVKSTFLIEVIRLEDNSLCTTSEINDHHADDTQFQTKSQRRLNYCKLAQS